MKQLFLILTLFIAISCQDKLHLEPVIEETWIGETIHSDIGINDTIYIRGKSFEYVNTTSIGKYTASGEIISDSNVFISELYDHRLQRDYNVSDTILWIHVADSIRLFDKWQDQFRLK